jgi:TolA-binding protein
MKALVLVIGLVAGCATHPVAPVSQAGYGYEPSDSSDEVLAREQAEIDQEARDTAKRIQLNQIEQQQLQIRQQQQQQREEQQRMEQQQQPQPQSYGTPTFSQ